MYDVTKNDRCSFGQIISIGNVAYTHKLGDFLREFGFVLLLHPQSEMGIMYVKFENNYLSLLMYVQIFRVPIMLTQIAARSHRQLNV